MHPTPRIRSHYVTGDCMGGGAALGHAGAHALLSHTLCVYTRRSYASASHKIQAYAIESHAMHIDRMRSARTRVKRARRGRDASCEVRDPIPTVSKIRYTI